MMAPAQTKESLPDLLNEARACRRCAEPFGHAPRPVLRAAASARLLIVGQAPGTRVHATGVPWNDPSGDRLRQWLDLDGETFYDGTRIAIVPMGLCYPGQDQAGADKPPPQICAPLWHPRLGELLENVRLTLLVGAYAQAFYLGDRAHRTMTETVANWRDYAPEFMPLPHPSWRNSGWLRRNPWFERELLAELRRRVSALL